jgi:hypothetical protein
MEENDVDYVESLIYEMLIVLYISKCPAKRPGFENGNVNLESCLSIVALCTDIDVHESSWLGQTNATAIQS